MEACRDRPGAAGLILNALNNLLRDRFTGERAILLTSGNSQEGAVSTQKSCALGHKEPGPILRKGHLLPWPKLSAQKTAWKKGQPQAGKGKAYLSLAL